MKLVNLANSVMNHGDFHKTVMCLAQTHHTDTSIQQVYMIYSDVMRELLDSDMTDKYADHQLVLDDVVDEETNEQYVGVTLKKQDETWAIDFIPWGDLLCCEVVDNVGVDTSNLLAHILWELTFWGWTNSDVQEQASTLSDPLSGV